MRPSERYAAARKSGYLVRPDRHECDPGWITYCMATQRPYIVITQTPQYAHLVIDCSPLAAATVPPAAVWERLTRLGAAAVQQSPSIQAKVRITGSCLRIQSVTLGDALAIAERVAALFPLQPKPLPVTPRTDVIDLAAERSRRRGLGSRLSLRERVRAGHTPGGDAA